MTLTQRARRLPVRGLRSGCVIALVASFAAAAFAWRANGDVDTLRDGNARWNGARPVIEDAIATSAVSALSAGLLSVLVVAWALFQRRAAPRAISKASWLGYALVVVGGVLWIAAAGQTWGVRVLLQQVTAAEALMVWENYEPYLDSWSRQTSAWLVTSFGWAVAAVGAEIQHRRDVRPLSDAGASPTP